MLSTMMLRKQLPEKAIGLLLAHSNPEISGTVAVHEWESSSGQIPMGLADAWRKAIVQCSGKIHGIEDIMAKDASIAKEWLGNMLADEEAYISAFDYAVHAAFSSLSKQDRIDLLSKVSTHHYFGEGIDRLVGSDLDVYAALLANTRLKSLHLHLFEGPISDTWIAMAKMAIKAGHAPNEVAGAALLRSHSWSGSEAAMWEGERQIYQRLVDNSDSDIQEIGRILVGYCVTNAADAAAREKRQSVLGIA